MLMDSLNGMLINVCATLCRRFISGEPDTEWISIASVHSAEGREPLQQPASAATRIKESFITPDEL